MKQKRQIVLVLDNIRSVHNVGSIFRTAECAGVPKIVCCGTTPCPVDRFGRKRGDFAKVSLGAEDSIGWENSRSTITAVRKLKKMGFQIIALEQSDNSIDYRQVKVNAKTVVVVGNEVEGVNKKVMELAAVIAEIPMAGKKESLNVSVAAGILLFEIS